MSEKREKLKKSYNAVNSFILENKEKDFVKDQILSSEFILLWDDYIESFNEYADGHSENFLIKELIDLSEHTNLQHSKISAWYKKYNDYIHYRYMDYVKTKSTEQ